MGAGLRGALCVGRRHQLEHFLESRDLEHAVVARVPTTQFRQAFAHAQRLQFREREVLGEPARDRLTVDGLRGPARREFRVRCHIRGAADFVFVAHHERAVPRDHEIGFHVIRALLNRDEIARQRVLGQVTAGAAMRYDKWRFGRRH